MVGNLVYVLGQLQYEKLESEGADYWIVVVAVTGGAMLTVIFVILIVCNRKSTRAERQFKRLQMQLDSLESNIRNECKQGEWHHAAVYSHFYRHYASAPTLALHCVYFRFRNHSLGYLLTKYI